LLNPELTILTMRPQCLLFKLMIDCHYILNLVTYKSDRELDFSLMISLSSSDCVSDCLTLEEETGRASHLRACVAVFSVSSLRGKARAKGKSRECMGRDQKEEWPPATNFLSPLSLSPRATPACLKGNRKDCYAGYTFTLVITLNM